MVAGIASLFALATGVDARAATVQILPGANTLGAAIASTAAGDTILLSPGTYTSPAITVSTPRVIESSAGPWDTILDFEYRFGSEVNAALYITDHTDRTIVRGLTITRAMYGGIHVVDSSPTLENNIIVDCYAVADIEGGSGPGGGLVLYGGAPVVRNNTIVGNVSSFGAIFFVGGTARVERNVIAHSVSDPHTPTAYGISCANGAAPLVVDNIFWANAPAPWAASCSALPGLASNALIDPQFCAPSSYGMGDWRVVPSSPLAPGRPYAGYGAEARYCGAVPAQKSTWGSLKARYR